MEQRLDKLIKLFTIVAYLLAASLVVRIVGFLLAIGSQL